MRDLGSCRVFQSLELRARRQHLAQAADFLGTIGERPARGAWWWFSPGDEGVATALTKLAHEVREERPSPAQGLVDPAPDLTPLIVREREHAAGRCCDRKPVVDEEPGRHQNLTKARGLEGDEVTGCDRAGALVRAGRLLDRDRVISIASFPQPQAILLDRAGNALAERQDHAKPSGVLSLI